MSKASAAAIVKWAEQQAAPAHTPKYKRLTDTEKAFALRYAADGLTQVDIAKRLGVTQSAISRWLAQCDDTTVQAKSYLRGSALRMAEKVVKHGDPATQLKALQGVGVIESEQRQGIVVQIGVKADRLVMQPLSALEGTAATALQPSVCTAPVQVVDAVAVTVTGSDNC